MWADGHGRVGFQKETVEYGICSEISAYRGPVKLWH